MKKARILLSLLLSLTLVFVLTPSAYAAQGTLAVADPGTETYRTYRIFTATDSGDGNVAYTLEDPNWIGVLIDTAQPGNAADGVHGLTFTDDGTGKYQVVKSDSFVAADFAQFLKDHIPAGATYTEVSGTPTSLDAGYYLIVSSADSFATMQDKAMLTTVLDDKAVKVQNKNDMPFDKTVDDVKVEGVQVGDTLNFQITSKVPGDIADHTSYVYLASDTMDPGLTFTGPITATVGGTAVTLTEIADPTAILTGNQVRYNANSKSFEVSLDLVGKTAGAPILITYTAVVNQDAAGTVTENNAVLEYGHDPNDLTVKDTQTKVYTSKIIVDKFETGAPEQKLSGAEFVLYKTVNEGGTDVTYYYKADENGNVSWVKSADLTPTADTPATATNISRVVTDTNGAASFSGLEDATYYLKETKAPAGYTLITEPITIEINGEVSTAVGLTDEQVVLALTHVANVANTPGTNLPSTGGVGTTIFYLVGSVLVLGGLAVLVIRKRKDTEA